MSQRTAEVPGVQARHPREIPKRGWMQIAKRGWSEARPIRCG
jgi:membrane protein